MEAEKWLNIVLATNSSAVADALPPDEIAAADAST